MQYWNWEWGWWLLLQGFPKTGKVTHNVVYSHSLLFGYKSLPVLSIIAIFTISIKTFLKSYIYQFVLSLRSKHKMLWALGGPCCGTSEDKTKTLSFLFTTDIEARIIVKALRLSSVYTCIHACTYVAVNWQQFALKHKSFHLTLSSFRSYVTLCVQLSSLLHGWDRSSSLPTDRFHRGWIWTTLDWPLSRTRSVHIQTSVCM